MGASVSSGGAVGEETAARPEDDRVDRQEVLVDEVASHQRPDQLPAAEDAEVLVQLFEAGHLLRGVPIEECRVTPRQRLGQRGGRDVLLAVVEHLGEGIVRSVGPYGGEVQIGSSPQEQRTALSHPLSHDRTHDLVAIGRGPTAVRKAPAAVFIGAGRSLHHTIEREVLDNHDPAHWTP
jgi:hypothetical protein